ncbi:hypothetical protein ACHAW5_001887 [Stephanodiscus triporus]|uniref:HTH CENPB-type domain-containing protein n=1 Tax=Stephanodiscus triporus TaxID=2934178 RepID=A0ABD3R631_9STRA
MSQSRFLHKEYSQKIRKAANNAAINVAIADLVAARNVRRADGGKRLIRSSQPYKHVITSLQSVGVDITYDALVKRVSRAVLEEDTPRVEPEIRLSMSEESLVSSLSSLSDESLTSKAEDITETALHEDQSELKSSAGGRPKGSTKAKKKQDLADESNCIDAIVSEYSRHYIASKSVGEKVEYGYLKRLIDEKKKEFGIHCNISSRIIHNRTHIIHNRTHRALPTPRSTTYHMGSHHGAKSPLEEVESALVHICIQMGKIRQPLSCTEAITLMNDMIENTNTKQKLIEFQQCRKLGTDDFVKGRVTTGWWRGFLRRHEDKLVTKRGEKFALNRSDWTTLPNIKQMYEVIYDEMVDANVAVSLDSPVFTDIDGKPEDHETKRFGLAQHIKITKPEWILFADESGFNTSQKKDGHVGGQKFVVQRGTAPQIMSSTTDHKFTMLPFTSASGEAVCCVIIFQGKGGVPATWRTGVDHSVTPILAVDGEFHLELNFGEGKYYPGGPTCKYNGKFVDSLVFTSESGGITAEILVEILTYFDSIDLFPRVPGGPIPFLIVDGHQTRLDPIFVEYINDSNHTWKVCLGVPYATSLWQVGDASEQNGMVKSEWYREKKQLLSWKYLNNLPRAIRPDDVMPLMNKIFYKSYDNVANNKKAVAVRGWYPPNMALLEHPSLIAEKNANPPTQLGSSPPFPDINVEAGLAGSVLDIILRERSKSDGAKKAAEKRKLTSDSIAENILKSQRLTSGVMTKNAIHSLSDPNFLEPFRQRRIETQKKIEEKKSKRKALHGKLARAVQALREKWGHEKTHCFEQCDKNECGAYLQYKKQQKDKAMPKDLIARRGRCVEWITRPSPTASPNQSDEEDTALEGEVEECVDEDDNENESD